MSPRAAAVDVNPNRKILRILEQSREDAMEIMDSERLHREGLGRFHAGDAFFNPLQEFQRDIGVLAARVHTEHMQQASVM